MNVRVCMCRLAAFKPKLDDKISMYPPMKNICNCVEGLSALPVINNNSKGAYMHCKTRCITAAWRMTCSTSAQSSVFERFCKRLFSYNLISVSTFFGQFFVVFICLSENFFSSQYIVYFCIFFYELLLYCVIWAYLFVHMYVWPHHKLQLISLTLALFVGVSFNIFSAE